MVQSYGVPPPFVRNLGSILDKKRESLNFSQTVSPGRPSTKGSIFKDGKARERTVARDCEYGCEAVPDSEKPDVNESPKQRMRRERFGFGDDGDDGCCAESEDLEVEVSLLLVWLLGGGEVVGRFAAILELSVVVDERTDRKRDRGSPRAGGPAVQAAMSPWRYWTISQSSKRRSCGSVVFKRLKSVGLEVVQRIGSRRLWLLTVDRGG